MLEVPGLSRSDIERLFQLLNAEFGEGARINGGRWNGPGYHPVYVSESRALATLEVLAGLGREGPLSHYSLIGVRFAEELVMEVASAELPEGWDSSPSGPGSQAVGNRWLAEERSVALRVPSVVVPAESHYVLNPSHSDFGQVQIDPPEELQIDPRLQ